MEALEITGIICGTGIESTNVTIYGKVVVNMFIVAQIVGMIAVTTFLLSYQQKKRKNIILMNATSSMLYVLQYLLLGAFAGAVLDILSTISTVAAHNKNKGFIAKHTKWVVVAMNVSIFVAGMTMYENIFSLCPIAGAILQTSAFWITDEKRIRKVSFLAAPFWLVYNLVSMAYGSAIGSALSLVSIGLAIYRYDIAPTMKSKKGEMITERKNAE